MSGTIAWPDFTRVFALAEPIIKNAEGFVAKPYLCPAGVPTIGWGTTRYPDGRKVTMSDPPVSQIEAEVFMQSYAQRVMRDLEAPGIVRRSPSIHQSGALLSLAYNIGVGAHDGITGDLADSTLLSKFNAGDFAGAADQFLVWDKAHVAGKVVMLPGLARRRAVERALFLEPDSPSLV